jgi:hypothetical protein
MEGKMPYSVLHQRCAALAAEIGEPSLCAAVDAFLLHEAFPGPVVAVLGGTGRGKSRLFAAMTGLQPPVEGAPMTLAGGATWHGLAHSVCPPSCRFEATDAMGSGSSLMIDAPPFDRSSDHDTVRCLLGISDLAIMTVQVTHPTGAEEVQFAREHLTDLAAVLVITKCDLVEDDEFEDVRDAILAAYREIPWQAILVSERGEGGAARGGLPAFQRWWTEHGTVCAADARAACRGRMLAAWTGSARETLSLRESKIEEELQGLHGRMNTKASVKRALSLKESVYRQLAGLPERTLDLYRSRLNELRSEFHVVVSQDLDAVTSGDAPDPSRLQSRLGTLIADWDSAARASIRESLEPTMRRLRQEAEEFCGLVNALCSEFVDALVPAGSVTTAEYSREVAWTASVDVDTLSSAERVRPISMAVLSGIGGTLSVNAIAAVALGVLALPLAAVAGAVAAWTTFSTLSDTSRRKARADLERRLEMHYTALAREVQQRFHGDWKQLCHEIQSQLHPFERRLDTYLFACPRQPDADLQPRLAVLSRNRARLRDLQGELNVILRTNDHAGVLIHA